LININNNKNNIVNVVGWGQPAVAHLCALLQRDTMEITGGNTMGENNI